MYKRQIHRNIEFKDNDFEITGTIDIGFPQGGVCSAKFWIIAFDYALNIINTDLTEGQGFADDLCILTQGTNLTVMQQRMQAVLNQLVDKSREANLTFGSEKTVAMLFSPQKRKTLTRLYINGSKLKTVDSTRYLGVTIDNTLSLSLIHI